MESWTTMAQWKKCLFMFQLALKRFRMICCAMNEMANLRLGHLRRAESFTPAMQTQLDFHLVCRGCCLHKARRNTDDKRRSDTLP